MHLTVQGYTSQLCCMGIFPFQLPGCNFPLSISHNANVTHICRITGPGKTSECLCPSHLVAPLIPMAGSSAQPGLPCRALTGAKMGPVLCMASFTRREEAMKSTLSLPVAALGSAWCMPRPLCISITAVCACFRSREEISRMLKQVVGH